MRALLTPTSVRCPRRNNCNVCFKRARGSTRTFQYDHNWCSVLDARACWVLPSPVGRHRRRPPVPASIADAADTTWATARVETVFPSDEKHRAQQWCCKGSGPLILGRRQATFQRMVMYHRTKRQLSCRFFACAALCWRSHLHRFYFGVHVAPSLRCARFARSRR